MLIESSSNRLGYAVYGSYVAYSNDNIIELNAWQHVTVVYDESSDSVAFYIDGQPAGTAGYSTSPVDSANDPLVIGIRGYDSNRAFDGTIDQVRIYNRALAADEVLALFNQADSLVFSPIGNKEVDEGLSLTFDVNTTDPNIVVDINDHNLPGEPDFFSNGGGGWSFGWTPTYNDAGTYEVTFEAIYDEFLDSETITITVNNVNRAPEIEPINDITADEGTLISFVVTASDPDNDDITCYGDNLPAGSTFENYTFEWTPGYDQAGTHIMSFVATDGELEDVEGVIITVNDSQDPTNQPPTANAGLDQSITDSDGNGSEEVALNGSSSSDSDGSIVNYIWTEGGNQIATGVNPVVTLTVGIHTITLTVTDDDGATGIDTLTVTVTLPANQAPVISSVTATPPEIFENETSQLQVSADDPDDGPDGLSYSWTIQGGAGSLNNSNIANPVYTPPDVNNTVIVTLTVQVSDGEFEDSETITVMVKKVNRPPMLETIGKKLINENSLLSFSISATDADGDTITYSAQNLPFGATFIGQTFAWTPSLGQAGTYQVTFIAGDGQDTDSETITITVNSINVDLLFSDNFSDNNYSGWNIVDEGNRDAPSSWSASTGTMIQSSNIYSLPTDLELPKLGTYAWYTDGIDWTDYRTTLTIRSEDDDAIGLMFRYQDNENYYRFSWDKQRSYRRLIKKVNGDVSLLDEDTVQYATGQNYRVEVIAQGDNLQVFIDGTLTFSETDSSLISGTIALYSWGNIGSYFDDILVEDLPHTNKAPLISSVTATPSTISDANQISQLLATASDPDSGPSGLTYNWTVQLGEGSLSNTNVANPVYTPPDVDASQTFTLTVEVSDGEDTTTGSVNVTVINEDNSYLLFEDFDDGDFAGWTIIDQGNMATPSDWSAATGTMIQSSNIYLSPENLTKLGTFAWYPAGMEWTDYQLNLMMRSNDDDSIGVMFRYQDENNYYRFEWDKQRAYCRLSRFENGSFKILGEAPNAYAIGQWYDVEITAKGSKLEVFIDGLLIFSVTDNSLTSGSIALYTWGNAGGYFDDITVQEIAVPAQTLPYAENFDDGYFDGWSIVDEGNYDGPSSWSANTGTLIQNSNIYSLPTGPELPKLGTYAFYKFGNNWIDYQFNIAIRSEDDDSIGVMFRYQDNNNYYRFSWDSQRSYRRLVKKQNGLFTLLAEDRVPYVTDQTYQIEVVAQDTKLEVSIDGMLIFSVIDNSFASGTIALYTWGNAGGHFDDLVVEGF